MSRYSELSEEDVEDLRYFGYIINTKIGQGTFSKVYQASFHPDRAPSTVNQSRRLRRSSSVRFSTVFLEIMKFPKEKLACKVIEKSYKMPKNYPHKFLQTELNIFSKLQHPYIPTLHSILRIGPKFLVFMSLAEFGNLCDYITKKGPIEESVVKRWTRQLTLALIYIHTMGIAHRDISCDNILISGNYNVKLSDFGYSCFHFGAKYSHTRCGSMPYVAPEVIRGSPYNPKYSDIWSLGVVLFIMLNGSFPFFAHCYEFQYADQMDRNYTFKTQLIPLISVGAIEKVKEMLEPNPLLRISLQEIVESQWLTETTAQTPYHILKNEQIAQKEAQDAKEGMELMHGKTKKYSITYPWIRIEKETYCQRMSNLMKRHRMRHQNRITFGEELHFHFKTSRYPTVSDFSMSEHSKSRPVSLTRVAATSSDTTLETVITKPPKSASSKSNKSEKSSEKSGKTNEENLVKTPSTRYCGIM